VHDGSGQSTQRGKTSFYQRRAALNGQRLCDSRRYAQRWPVPPPHFATVPRDLGTHQPSLMLDPNASIVRHRSPHISTTRVGPARRPGPTVTRGRHMCVLSASPRMEDGWVFGSRVPPHAHKQTITRKLTTCPRPGRIGGFRERKHLLT
jgi:hypothetical protein